MKHRPLLAFPLLLSLLSLLAAAAPPPQVVDVPEHDVGAETLAARERAERAGAAKMKVFHDFQFHDRTAASGITFVHHIVDDAGKTYKAAHYDHGNGIVAADVDGDGLIDVYFLNQLGGNELWKNLGHGKFKNITAEAGVGLPGRISVSATFADINNDGCPDLYVTTVRGGNAMFLNDCHGHFKDVTREAGLEYTGHSSAAVFFDYDRDGRLDLLLVNVGKYTTDEQGPGGYYLARPDAFQSHLKPERTEYKVLYHNEGNGHFRDVTREMGLIDGSWSGDATITDFNGDGWPDLFIINMQGPSHYWENEGGKRFVDKTAQYFPKTPFGTMGVKVFDYNNDGLLDLFLTDMHSDMLKELTPQEEKAKIQVIAGNEKALRFFGSDLERYVFGNAFYKNLGNGHFAEVSDELGLENYWPWGVSVADLNADGWPDVLITAGMNFPFRYGVNSLLLNDRGEGFRDAAFLLGIEPRLGGATRQPWFTLDCSGADRQHKLCQGRSGQVTVTGTRGTRSSVIFDVDNDGALDIITNEFNAPPRVLLSDLAERRAIHWLKLHLVGKQSNRDGIGALVKVTAGGITMTQLVDGNSGYLSHSDLPLYFGLGEAAAADKIEVRWPSGRVQTLAGPIAGNRLLEVVEPPASKAAAAAPGRAGRSRDGSSGSR
jgi:enediyne biosynthesis protein E4